MGLMAKEECLIFPSDGVSLEQFLSLFLSHCVCFVPVVLTVLISVVPYSPHVVSVLPLGPCTREVALSKVMFMRRLSSTVILSLSQSPSSLTSIHRVKALSQDCRRFVTQVCLVSGVF